MTDNAQFKSPIECARLPPMKKAAPRDDNKSNDTHIPHADLGLADPFVLGQVLMDVYQRAQPLLKDFLDRYKFDPGALTQDPLNLRPAYMDFLTHLMSDPQKLAEMQVQFWQDWMALWQQSALRFLTGEGEDVIKPEKGDRRFKSPLWEESALFDFIKQSYLLTSKWMEETVQKTQGLDEETRSKVDFYTRQFLGAMAPSNFLLTNPEVLKETLETKGENLIRGLENLLEDLERGHGELKISITDYDAFRLGENIALTPGKVVYQNDLMQLIQYEPATEKVFKRPLLVVPPWINKYYILDLRPNNSLVKWMVEQGHTVFVISWVNPSRELAKKRFEDYMLEGVLEAQKQIEKITGEPDCNAISYCLGGTLLSVTLAWLAAQGQADKIASASFMTTMVDFEKAGEMKMFMDASQLKLLDKQMSEKGFLPADHLKQTFSLLRANDLIWSFVVNNYLMGREPFPFDLLYWNDDATNMPAAMHSFYMRKCYGDNLLPVPGGVTMNGVDINMHKVETPSFFLSTKEDHIAPWKATYATTQLFGGPCHFTLAASGHVAGVVNPPAANKYCYWTAEENPPNPDQWLEKAKMTEGSWWPHWQEWVKAHTGPLVPARAIGEFIEPAPGAYVKMKAD